MRNENLQVILSLSSSFCISLSWSRRRIEEFLWVKNICFNFPSLTLCSTSLLKRCPRTHKRFYFLLLFKDLRSGLIVNNLSFNYLFREKISSVNFLDRKKKCQIIRASRNYFFLFAPYCELLAKKH